MEWRWPAASARWALLALRGALLGPSPIFLLVGSHGSAASGRPLSLPSAPWSRAARPYNLACHDGCCRSLPHPPPSGGRIPFSLLARHYLCVRAFHLCSPGSSLSPLLPGLGLQGPLLPAGLWYYGAERFLTRGCCKTLQYGSQRFLLPHSLAVNGQTVEWRRPAATARWVPRNILGVPSRFAFHLPGPALFSLLPLGLLAPLSLALSLRFRVSPPCRLPACSPP